MPTAAEHDHSDKEPAEKERLLDHHESMDAAFAKVQNPLDWKGPISAIVAADELETTLLAIGYFTATRATITMPKPGEFLVESVGYRAGPAGDH